MVKVSAVAACVLALSASAAMAQSTWLGGWLPQAQPVAPLDSKSASPMRDVDVDAPSGGYLAEAAPQLGSGPHRAYMTDEYGFKYDRRGDRLDARGHVISPHTP
jgi:hypothetical protein